MSTAPAALRCGMQGEQGAVPLQRLDAQESLSRGVLGLLETLRTGEAWLYDDTANPSSPRSWGCSRSIELRFYTPGGRSGRGQTPAKRAARPRFVRAPGRPRTIAVPALGDKAYKACRG